MLRVSTVLFATALIRRVQAEGGNAALLSKGDPERGSIILHIAEKGVVSAVWERNLDFNGDDIWINHSIQNIDIKGKIEEYTSRRLVHDPDLWVIELDVLNAERFIADISS
jgi:hypothetical protein